MTAEDMFSIFSWVWWTIAQWLLGARPIPEAGNTQVPPPRSSLSPESRGSTHSFRSSAQPCYPGTFLIKSKINLSARVNVCLDTFLAHKHIQIDRVLRLNTFQFCHHVCTWALSPSLFITINVCIALYCLQVVSTATVTWVPPLSPVMTLGSS